VENYVPLMLRDLLSTVFNLVCDSLNQPYSLDNIADKWPCARRIVDAITDTGTEQTTRAAKKKKAVVERLQGRATNSSRELWMQALMEHVEDVRECEPNLERVGNLFWELFDQEKGKPGGERPNRFKAAVDHVLHLHNVNFKFRLQEKKKKDDGAGTNGHNRMFLKATLTLSSTNFEKKKNEFEKFIAGTLLRKGYTNVVCKVIESNLNPTLLLEVKFQVTETSAGAIYTASDVCDTLQQVIEQPDQSVAQEIKSANAIFNVHRFEPVKDVIMRVQTYGALNKLSLLHYGMRCVCDHGQPRKTLEQGGAIWRVREGFEPKDFTTDGGGNADVVEEVVNQLNDLLGEITTKKDEFAPTYEMVVNAHRVFWLFTRTVSAAASKAALDVLSDAGRRAVRCTRLNGRPPDRPEQPVITVIWSDIEKTDDWEVTGGRAVTDGKLQVGDTIVRIKGSGEEEDVRKLRWRWKPPAEDEQVNVVVCRDADTFCFWYHPRNTALNREEYMEMEQ